MSRRLHICLAFVLLLSLAVSFSVQTPTVKAAGGSQHQFVYINDDNFAARTGNQLEGFSVSPTGGLMPVPGSPFSTGGLGGGGGIGFYSTQDLVIAPAVNALYAADEGSGELVVFHIDPSTGSLRRIAVRYPILVSPLAEITLAVTPDSKTLFVYSGSCNEIQACILAFSIADSGELTELPGRTFPFGPVADLLVTRDGKFLVATEPTISKILSYSINADGSLTPVPGSPFAAAGSAEGLDMDCSGQHIFVGDSTVSGSSIEVYTIAADGSLSAVPGSPFTQGRGASSATVRLSPNGRFLYVGNQSSGTLSVFRVGTDGALTELEGSPFEGGNPLGVPSELAVSESGGFVFVADYPFNGHGTNAPALDVLATQLNGSLRPVPASPIRLPNGSAPTAVVAFPASSCAN
jgi:6-phosphogluconolactonase (cycloisomerase 2 family)